MEVWSGCGFGDSVLAVCNLTRNIVVERGQVHLQLDIAGCEKSGSGSNGSNCVSSLIARHTKYIHNSIPFDHSFIPNTMPRCIVPKPPARHLVAQGGVRLFFGGFGLLCFGYTHRRLASSSGKTVTVRGWMIARRRSLEGSELERVRTYRLVASRA
jgi:hypothetical protein